MNFIMQFNSTTTKLAITFLIIVTGYLTARIGSGIILMVSKRKEVISMRHVQLVKIFRYLILISTILAALLYLRVDLSIDSSIIKNFFFKHL